MVRTNSKTVLVGVLKNKRDQKLLLREHWYRIPMAHMPKRNFTHLAFYQPAIFGTHGQRIEYYAPVGTRKILKREILLPLEYKHPRAQDDYAFISVKKVIKLEHPIRNIIPRRVTFGFTSLKSLLNAKDILQLYGVAPTEKIIQRALAHKGIETKAEHNITANGRRYRLDMAIECDNLKSHTSKAQKLKDKTKDANLTKAGWQVIRLPEKNILENLGACIIKIQKAVSLLS